MQKHRIYSVVTYFCREVEKVNIILLCFYSVSDANEAASSLCMCFSYKRDIFHWFFFFIYLFFFITGWSADGRCASSRYYFSGFHLFWFAMHCNAVLKSTRWIETRHNNPLCRTATRSDSFCLICCRLGSVICALIIWERVNLLKTG